MSRWGGAADVGHMWTDEEVSKYAQYQDKRGVTGQQVAVASGLGAGGFGIHHLTSTGNVPNQAAERAHQSVANYVQASGRNARAQSNLSHLNTIQANTRNPWKKWRNKGKVKEATVRAENAAREMDKTKHLAEVQRTHLSPAAMNARVRNKRLLGASLLAGGAAAVTSPLWAKKNVNKAMSETVLSGVSKTITQARYGANAEMGRKWRGEEKRDAKAPSVALAGAGLGAAGSAGALAAHGGIRRTPKPVDESAMHAQKIAGTRAARNAAHGEVQAAHQKLSDVRAGHNEWVNWVKGQGSAKRGEHPLKGQSAGGFTVGPKGGNIKGYLAHHENERAAKVTAASARQAEHTAAKEAAARNAADVAKYPKKIAGLKRIRRAGLAAAALGGATAIGAGVKAEADRNKATPGGGWSQPKRVRKALDPKKAKAMKQSGFGLGGGGLSRAKPLGLKRTSLLDMTPEQRAAWKAEAEAKMKRIRGR